VRGWRKVYLFSIDRKFRKTLPSIKVLISLSNLNFLEDVDIGKLSTVFSLP
jgi:hypothetical protein